MNARVECLSKFFDSCHVSLIRYLTRLLGCEDAARDVAQDAYIRFYTHRKRETIQHPRAYLFRIEHNAAVDRIARETTARNHIKDQITDASLPESLLPDSLVETEQRWQMMADALNELPRACRDAFVMNKLRGMTHSQIAKELGISRSMVEKHMMRAMAHCRNRLRKQF